ncbi:MAG: GxxExxY protein [Verrucomicrobiota bacterium]
MNENEISKIIVNTSIGLHRKLGPGLLESVYQRILAYELRKTGLRVETEAPVPIQWDGNIVDESFRADMIIEDVVLLELKSVEKLNAIHKKQVLTYLKLANIRLGILLNFGAELMKEGIQRVANGLPEEL